MWKVGGKMIKEEEDILNCKLIIKKHFKLLKDIHIYLASKSTGAYPGIAKWELSDFIKKAQIEDKVINNSAVDRLVIGTLGNRHMEAPDIVSQNYLLRFQFLEILVRLGNEKYRGMKICETFSESLEKIIEDCIIPHYHPEPWQQFRDNDLWKLDVEDVLAANVSQLDQIYKSFFTSQNKTFSLYNAITLCSDKCDLGIHEKDI